MPVGKFHGVGPEDGGEDERGWASIPAPISRRRPLEFLQQHFGKAGAYYYAIARGEDDRPVRARPAAQVGRRGEHLRARLVDVRGHERRARPDQSTKSGGYCEQAEIRGRTVTLKVKFQDFQQITRSRSFASAVECRVYLEKAALDLLSALFPLRKGVRLLGVTLSGLEEKRGKRAQLALPLP